MAVIDEIQMIKDPSRGWAWTRALLGGLTLTFQQKHFLFTHIVGFQKSGSILIIGHLLKHGKMEKQVLDIFLKLGHVKINKKCIIF